MRTEKIAARALDRLNGDRYKLSLVVAKRSEELASGAEPLVEVGINQYKPVDIAIMEVAEGKIGLNSFVSK